jgi:pyruvate/2-oxoacid:ferredoxin oxidoreductase beta subunit
VGWFVGVRSFGGRRRLLVVHLKGCFESLVMASITRIVSDIPTLGQATENLIMIVALPCNHRVTHDGAGKVGGRALPCKAVLHVTVRSKD